MSVAIAENSIDSKEQFMMEVVFDGRYVDEVSRQPEWVANRLGLEVDAGVLLEIEGEDTYALLSRSTRWLSGEIAQTAVENNIQPATPVLGVGTAIGIIALAIGVGAIVTVVCEYKGEDGIADRSAEADYKL